MHAVNSDLHPVLGLAVVPVPGSAIAKAFCLDGRLRSPAILSRNLSGLCLE